MKKLNVALVGCWHPHVPRYYPILQKREDTALTCVWDSTPTRGNEWAQKLGVPFVADYDELLKRPETVLSNQSGGRSFIFEASTPLRIRTMFTSPSNPASISFFPRTNAGVVARMYAIPNLTPLFLTASRTSEASAVVTVKLFSVKIC